MSEYRRTKEFLHSLKNEPWNATLVTLIETRVSNSALVDDMNQIALNQHLAVLQEKFPGFSTDRFHDPVFEEVLKEVLFIATWLNTIH